MIAALFKKKLPFAIAISQCGIGDTDKVDKFIIVPSTGSADYLKHVSKDFKTVECREVKKTDWNWFKANREHFKLVVKSEEGLVYEPHYGFRELIRKTQIQLL